jgi:hypothetical protein
MLTPDDAEAMQLGVQSGSYVQKDGSRLRLLNEMFPPGCYISQEEAGLLSAILRRAGRDGIENQNQIELDDVLSDYIEPAEGGPSVDYFGYESEGPDETGEAPQTPTSQPPENISNDLSEAIDHQEEHQPTCNSSTEVN